MAKAKESDVVLNFKMDGQVQYAQTIKEINQVMNTAASEYKNQLAAMGKDATQTEKLTAAKKKLEIQLEGAEKRSKQLRDEYEKSVKETGAYSEQSKKLYKQLQDSETGEHKLREALENTNEALREQGDVSIDTAKKIAKIEEAGEKVKGVGVGMTAGITAPILAIGAAGLSAFGTVDEAMDTIIVKTGATGDAADNLTDSFKKVAGNTHLDIQTVGEAVGEVNTQFGFLDEQLESSTDYMLKFAEINGTDVSQSAINAKKAIEAYGLSNEDLNMVLDTTTKAAQDTGQSVDTLFDRAVAGAPQIKQLGLSFGEGVTLMGQFEKQGVDSSAALGSMSKATAVYAKEGKTLSQGMGELQDKIKNATSETEAINLAGEVFGNRGGAKMADAIRRGVFNLEDLATTAEGSVGVVGDTFEATQDPIDKAQQAMNQATLALADVGAAVQVALLPTFEKAIELLGKFKEWFTSLSPETQQFIVKIALVAAAIGPLLFVLGSVMGSVTKIVTGVKTFMNVFKGLQLMMAANPFTLLIIAIVALIAIFVLAYTKVKWFRDGVNAFLNGIKDVGIQVFNFLAGFIGNSFGGIIANFENMLAAVKRIFGGIIDFITGVFTGNWSQAWQGVKDIFGGIMDGIAAGVKAPINAMISLINSFIGGLSNIKIPKWVPGIGGKGFNIPQIPYLATGGHMLNGQAIVGEAGPELLTNKGGKTTVTPLSDEEKRKGIGGKIGGGTIEQTINIQNVNTSSVNELNSMNRQIKRASEIAISGMRGD
ncbi:phage tail tape measure protein [Carnobacterium maltaromaticum]|nr:phage tail tape measure protein [Carnobacterium maltaromaticum]TFJ71878.1 phage tail tape measure protein [Carnobacterium maltaromaticum]TFJ76791.1 phage tail tape measure protein [Carnobacterium maltaromaticum]